MSAELHLESTGPDGHEDADPDGFKAVFRHHPAGVAVVTMAGPDGPAGLTVTSVASVSAEPPILAFSVAAGSSSRAAVDQVSSVAINFLAEDQQPVAEAFARRRDDRFAGVAWEPLPTGEPVLDGAAAWIRGDIEQRIPVGSSLLVTVRAVELHRRDGARALVYVDRSYHRLSELTRLPRQDRV